MIDRQEILDNADIVEVIGKYIHLKKTGGRWKGSCPFHDEKTASFVVNEAKGQSNGFYKCFGCQKGGNAIDFLMEMGHTFKEAVNELTGGLVGNPNLPAPKPKERPKLNSWEQCPIPEGENIQAPDFNHYNYGQPSDIWTYHDAGGKTLGHVCRFNFPDGSKQTLPYVYARQIDWEGKPTGKVEWRWNGFSKPRPLYDLHRIASTDSKVTVLVVEGEKTAEAAKTLFPHVVVTTWIGGASAVTSTDWSPLTGRKVLFWPDNDWDFKYPKNHPKSGMRLPFHEQPGISAMLKASEIVIPIAKVVKWVMPPGQAAPNKWDVADGDWLNNFEPWLPENALAYSRSHTIDVPTPEFEFEIDEPITDLKVETPKQVDDKPPEGFDESHFDEEMNFKFLGFSNDGGTIRHHFFSYSSQTVVSMTASGISGLNILQLAPLNWWEHRFPRREGMSMKAIANWLVQTSNRIGYFSEKMIRGRGAWVDNSDVVLHVGDKLVVNGKHVPFPQYHSKYIYEAGEVLGINTANPLPVAEAAKIIDITTLLNWDRDVNAYLLAGWCVIASVCGALPWRPHIWLTGAAGTGKSWVFKNIVRRLLGNTVVAVQGETSEAGLRQMLGHDALPVIFDEAEGEDRKAQERMQSVLALMRAASADDGGVMAKGTSSGSAKTFRIRSSFAFASIAVQLAQQSDRTRVTILGMKSLRHDENIRRERWEKLQELYISVITDEYVQRLQARTIWLLPIILENAKVFSTAAAAILGEQRAGDQLGAMLAGAYSLRRNDRVTYEVAYKWVKDKNWEEEKDLDENRDENALLSFLMEQMTQVECKTGRVERSVGELILVAMASKHDLDLTPDIAYYRLSRMGFKFDGGDVVISNQASWIIRALEKTPWARNHNKILMRVEGASATQPTTFGSGIRSRAVKIPINQIF